ncbi:Increased DNA methylation 1 [Sesamum angolense]|uniref:Increased DNA methylation 1 n=1 Tax=Sesamum angolense TaxID=2727404 RepID=A0AAE1WKL7_9LAMI|nr:Increased DNA methylation 1 [Sesamum angolense]
MGTSNSPRVTGSVEKAVMRGILLEMVDKKTKIDMIPQAIYNWGSEFNRLNFEGFYTVVLEKKNIVVSVASIRIHGVQVAELPFIATCSKFHGQGMCRLLVSSIEMYNYAICLNDSSLSVPFIDLLLLLLEIPDVGVCFNIELELMQPIR